MIESHFSQAETRWGRGLGLAAILCMAALGPLGGGCSSENKSSEEGATGGSGEGGAAASDCAGILLDGVCEGICDPAKCVENNTCVGNRCKLQCEAHADCQVGQECVEVTNDAGEATHVCEVSKFGAFGLPCVQGTECSPDTQCGGDGSCEKDELACQGIDDCVVGKCADGSPCALPCTGDDCPDLFCLTAGVGDTEAICTRVGCTSDDQCAAGYYCGVARDRKHEICGSGKGGSTFCGATPCSKDSECESGLECTNGACVDPTCIDSATFSDENGYLEGSVCLLQRTCLPRTQCAACETDLDCSATPGQNCIEIGGENRCATTCNDEKDCTADAECKEGHCVPYYGSCVGNGEFCDPCLDDRDCGDETTVKVCLDESGVRGCFDYSFPDECTTDADCPTSADGTHGECADGDDGTGVSSSDDIYHRCFLPYQDVSNKFACFFRCIEEDEYCYYDSDCCSGNCSSQGICK